MKRKVKHECTTCNVCDQDCERSAGETCDYPNDGYPTPCRPLPECYCCGDHVCRSCSSIRVYTGLFGNAQIRAQAGKKYGKQRLCNKCQEQMDDSPYRIVYRCARRCGYNHAAAKSYAVEASKPVNRWGSQERVSK